MSTIAADQMRSNDPPEGREPVLLRVARVVAPSSPWYASLKWLLDFSLAMALLVLTAPLVVVAMLFIKLTSRGPALYTQTRLGRGGRPFIIYKLRTMVHRCESLTGARWATAGDPRITPIGRLLRATHIDELPQLWNVLRGEMSLVGPRPERPEFVPRLEQAIPHYRARLLVKPGVTGLAQVQLPPDTDLVSVKLKLSYDLYYLQHAGVWLDLRLIASTALKMFGVPFRVLRAIFGYPHKDTVQRQYQRLPAEPRIVSARIQPA
jgi:lipopolysaccharide/colanic/teichoic acid biosynthesis glycosyltransferase